MLVIMVWLSTSQLKLWPNFDVKDQSSAHVITLVCAHSQRIVKGMRFLSTPHRHRLCPQPAQLARCDPLQNAATSLKSHSSLKVSVFYLVEEIHYTKQAEAGSANALFLHLSRVFRYLYSNLYFLFIYSLHFKTNISPFYSLHFKIDPLHSF